MNIDEEAGIFLCDGAQCVAIVNRPLVPSQKGVVIVVGGPQYRVGSHRQFTLLCRTLAERGVAAMRFDYRGMGDSEGETRSFEDVLPDIRAAIDHFCLKVPGLREISLWGLCDAASAVLLYAHHDSRVNGLVLLNPWVRTESSVAKAQLKHYYLSRLVDLNFWGKVVRGRFSVVRAGLSLASVVRAAVRVGKKTSYLGTSCPAGGVAIVDSTAPLPERMAWAFGQFSGKVLLVLSGNDLTAQEFNVVVRESGRWSKLLSVPKVELRELPAADHTFSRRIWRDQVAELTARWVLS